MIIQLSESYDEHLFLTPDPSGIYGIIMYTLTPVEKFRISPSGSPKHEELRPYSFEREIRAWSDNNANQASKGKMSWEDDWGTNATTKKAFTLNNSRKPPSVQNGFGWNNAWDTSEVKTVEKEVEKGPLSWRKEKELDVDNVTKNVNDKKRNDDKEKDPLSWKALLYDYTQDTTFHGVRFITSDTWFTFRKVWWGFLCLTCFSVFLFYVINRVQFFFTYTKNVNVEVEFQSKMEFPELILCNQNAFRITASAKNGFYNFVQEKLMPVNTSSEPSPCETTEFRCADGKCVHKSMRCDHFPDCPDSSDELECRPCPRLVVEGPTALESDGVVGGTFELVRNKIESGRVVFKKAGGTIYLYFTSGKWWFGETVGATNGKMRTHDSAQLPQDVKSTWEVNDGSNNWTPQKTVALKCLTANINMYMHSDSSNITTMNLTHMYVIGAHQKEDLFERCSWKGRACSVSNFTTRLTDYGICYSFNPVDKFVEDTGPSFALQITLNIERYEYTNSPRAGLGVKILLNPPSEIPLVYEQAFAVSPGSYSLIAIEYTEVKNLEPPWGVCGEKALDYYSNYTAASCKMDCQIKALVDECGCRDIYMPQKPTGEPKVCNLSTYVSCAISSLERIRKEDQFQVCPVQCPPQCQRNSYLPSLSFSSISTESFLGSANGEKIMALRKRLFDAREISYRLDKDKYRTTLRALYILYQNVTLVKKMIHAITHHYNGEKAQIGQILTKVNTDCYKATELLYTMRRELETKGLMPVHSYAVYLYPRLYDSILQYADWLFYLTNEYNKTISSGSFPSISWFKDHSGKASMLYGYLSVSANAAYEKVFSYLDSMVNTMQTFPDFELRGSLLGNIFNAMNADCSWCNKTQEPFMKTVKKRLRDFITGRMNHVTRYVIMNGLESEYNTFIKDLKFNQYNWVNITGFRNRVKRLSDDALGLFNELKQVTDETLMISINLLDEMRATISPYCTDDIRDIHEQYDNIHSRMASVLSDISNFLGDFDSVLKKTIALYEGVNKTLDEVARGFDYDLKTAFIQVKRISVDLLLRERVLSVAKIPTFINMLNFWLYAQHKASYLKDNNLYWKHLGISDVTPNVSTSPSTSQERDIDEVLSVNMPTKVNDYWNKMIEDTSVTLKEDLETHFDQLVRAITDTKTYFVGYLEGNQINDNFYRQNFLQMDIFYKELSVKKVTQNKAYEYQMLLSEIGGFMGLLLGASILTVLEVLDFIVYNIIRKCYRKHKVGP